jgi:hypothetical protein
MESLFTSCPVDGCTGESTAATIAERFGTADAQELASRGILTTAEAAWLEA